MKPSWVLSPDERERRFRKNKAGRVEAGSPAPAPGLCEVKQEVGQHTATTASTTTTIILTRVGGAGHTGPGPALLLPARPAPAQSVIVRAGVGGGAHSRPAGSTGSPAHSDSEESASGRSDSELSQRSVESLFWTEPELKFCEEELIHLNRLVELHDERYRSVNFGEQLIKEMIMCRWAVKLLSM